MTFNLVCSFCHNHASLISNVYPNGPGEEGPKSQALSLLTFYASHKPQKLPKIGIFLENRVENDLRKSRFGVSLAIINALLNECRLHASVISKSILRIIINIFNCPDTDLILLATNTFILYTSIRNHEDIIDSEFNILHTQLVSKFCTEATRQTADNIDQNKSRLSGLKALESLCVTDFFVDGAHIDDSIELVMSAILYNLKFQKDSAHSPTFPRMTRNVSNHEKRQSITDQLITDEELKQTAEKCWVGIFKKTNAETLKSLLSTLFKIMDKENKWEPSDDVLDILTIILSSTETQFHFVIVSIVLDRIESESQIGSKTTLVNLLRHFISHGHLGGVTILEFLDKFTRHLSLCQEQGVSSDLSRPLQNALIQAIGSLAIKLAYPTQFNEIIAFLVNRAQFAHPPESMTPKENGYLIALLNSLSEVVVKNMKASPEFRASVISVVLAYDVVSPLVTYFESPNTDVHISLYHLIMKCIQNARLESKSNSSRLEFFDNTRKALYLLALKPNNHPADFVIIGNLLTAMLTVDSYPDLGRTIPLIFHIQDKANILSASNQRALGSIFIDYFLFVGQYCGIKELLTYMTKIKDSRLKNNQWSPGVELSEEALVVLSLRRFSETEGSIALQPLTNKLNREEIIMLLTSHIEKDCPADLEKIKREWNREFEIDSTNKDQLSQLVSPQLPKKQIKTPSLNHKRSGSMASTTSKSDKPSLGIADFKEALVAKAPITNSVLDIKSENHELLKNIANTFGSTAQGLSITNENGDVAEHEMHLLNSRARAISNQSSGLSQRNNIKSLSPSYQSKLKQPPIFDTDEDGY
ncbi:Protein EFR3 B [Globomyces sp. JEL0801]|nr:Protein EFR3 B [Globomyces sp. JEL0801]